MVNSLKLVNDQNNKKEAPRDGEHSFYSINHLGNVRVSNVLLLILFIKEMMRMADSTIIVDIVDKSVPELNPKKIAIINQPNPAYGVTVTGRQLLHLIQFPQYWITESATGTVINGRNIFQYFPELDPEGGGSKKYTLISKAVYDNGIYKASDDNADGYRTMVVDVPSPVLVEKTITADGVYNPSDDNADGYSLVTVTHEPSGPASVIFYDYDGSVVESYTPEQFAGLTELPTNPSHEGLTSQGWNWSLSDAKSYVNKYGKLNIGQMYITDDGKTRIYITLTEGRTSPILQLCLNNNTTLDIDWGDGRLSKFTTASPGGYVSARHTYYTPGDYVISINVRSGSFALQSNATYLSSILWNGNDSTSSPDRAYNNAIKKVEIGSGVTIIGNNAFRTCYTLASITIPNTVTTIGPNAFSNCRSLKLVTLGSGVTTIGTHSFEYCQLLTTLAINPGVTIIGEYAFYYCYALSSITIPETVTSIGIFTFAYCSALTSVTIPDSVTAINANAFQNCESLTSITIPDSVTSIGNSAFNYCSALTSVTIPETVTSIGNSAFSSCYTLAPITIPDKVTTINAAVFSSCNAISSFTIPDTVTAIGDGAFAGCSSLASITIPDSVTSIGNNAFNNCRALSSITIPDGVTAINISAFSNCESLSVIDIPDSVTIIDGQGFYGCSSLASVTIGSGVTTIGAFAFGYCSYLESIKFTSTTPPTVSNSSAWRNVPTTCIIYVPAGTLNAYKSAANYPLPTVFTYIEY